MGHSANVLEARKTNDHYTFEQWLGFLDHAVLTCGWRSRIAEATGAECWLDYYSEGYTPMEALVEDCSCAN